MPLGWQPPITDRWTVGDDLTWCQLYLHDQGDILARDELLRWYQDAYRSMLAETQSTRQLHVLEVPPRVTMAYTHSWENSHVLGGTSRRIGYIGANGYCYTAAWEIEQAEGVTPSEGCAVTCTQLWEYQYVVDSGLTDQYYTFCVPRNHERIAKVYYDNKVLIPKSTHEVDHTESAWWREQGEPWLWLRGTGGLRSFDVYQLVSTYHEGYTLVTGESTTHSTPGNPSGIIRGISGDRTYSAESDDSAYPYGFLRAITSTDRQYLSQPTWRAPTGTIRECQGSSLSLLLWELVIPDHPALNEADIPDMIPAPLQKYLRAFVLARAFARQGELQRLDLAAWYEQRWQRGILLLKRLGFVARHDRTYQRQGVSQHSRAVPRPRLPSTFPRTLGA